MRNDGGEDVKLLRQGRTRKKTLSTCGWFHPLALGCVLALYSVGGGFTGDPKGNVLETLDCLVMPGSATDSRSLVFHRPLSTVIFPERIN